MYQAATWAHRNRKPYLLSAVSTETCQRSARSTRQTHPDPSVGECLTTGKGSRCQLCCWRKKTLENICELYVTSWHERSAHCSKQLSEDIVIIIIIAVWIGQTTSGRESQLSRHPLIVQVRAGSQLSTGDRGERALRARGTYSPASIRTFHSQSSATCDSNVYCFTLFFDHCLTTALQKHKHKTNRPGYVCLWARLSA